MRRLVPLALALALSPACDPEEGEEQEDAEGEDSMAECSDSDEPASVTLQNRTGVPITMVTMRACDGSELEDFPIRERRGHHHRPPQARLLDPQLRRAGQLHQRAARAVLGLRRRYLRVERELRQAQLLGRRLVARPR